MSTFWIIGGFVVVVALAISAHFRINWIDKALVGHTKRPHRHNKSKKSKNVGSDLI